MTLQKRLAKLEAQRQRLHGGPRVIMFNVCWRDDKGNLQSIAQTAKVLTGTGWEAITREADEPEAEFQLRADALAGELEAGRAWALAARRRNPATHDPA
jgi:hypothetical protein